MSNEYGVLWYIKCNGGKKGDGRIPNDKYPSLRQIMSGLEEYMKMYVQNQMANCNPRQIKQSIATYKKAFDAIIKLIHIPDIDKSFEDSSDPIYGLCNALS